MISMLINSKKIEAIFFAAIMISMSCQAILIPEHTPNKPFAEVLNIFCFVFIGGYWFRCNFIVYILIEEIVYWIGRLCEKLAKIVFPILDAYMEWQRVMPVKIYRSKPLLCMTYEGCILTVGAMGINKVEEHHEGYCPMSVTLYGFTGIWFQFNNSDLAIGFAECVLIP
ncbi:MAG: hypothetical protein J7L80_02790 [Thermoplasmata archaeon]|nr:hypothetical protein [Thermoplasmata archaeon]